MTLHCKLCNAAADDFGSVDFNRSGNDHFEKRRLFPVPGEPVPYYRCTACGFIFTPFFENWQDEDYRTKIYNADYILADPPFAEDRPALLSHYLEKVLAEFKTTVTMLDYGCGNGKLVSKLRDLGFTHIEGYDPFNAKDAHPVGRYDDVVSFEVVEHVADQKALFDVLFSHVLPEGILVISTLLQPEPVSADWWYICPRNGHAAFHTHQSLTTLMQSYGYNFVSLTDELHIISRGVNPYTQRFETTPVPHVNQPY